MTISLVKWILLAVLVSDISCACFKPKTVVISSGGRRMDYEGELMSEPINYKQVWYWSVATADGWDTLTSRKNYHSAQILKFKENACVNGSAVAVDNKVGLQPYSLWLPREGGYLISKCGPGFRLRKVGDWVKVIEDDPGKFSDDDKFDFQSVNM